MRSKLKVVHLKKLFFILCTPFLTASSPYWLASHALPEVNTSLVAAASQPKITAQVALANAFMRNEQRSESLYWLQRAALQGSTDSALELAQHLPTESERWLQVAANMGAVKTQVQLAFANLDDQPSYSFSQQNISRLTESERSQLATVALVWGDIAIQQHWRNLAPNNADWNKMREIDDLFRGLHQSCDRIIEFQLENQSGLVSVYQWVGQIIPLFESVNGNVCVSKYQTQKPLDCTPDDALNGNRAFCSNAVVSAAERTLVVVTQEGHANTRNGVVYIAEDENWRIFLHELAHAWGLADEYRMRSDVRERYCSGDFSFQASNLVFAESGLLSDSEFSNFIQQLPWLNELETGIASEVAVMGATYWNLGTSSAEGIGLYPAATCEGTGIQAWKPFAQNTFLEHAETGDIPNLYLQWMLHRN